MTAPRNIILRGDCVEVMRTLPADSIDAIVTDPPYGIDFMGKEWDGFGTPHGFQTWTEQWAREAFRILKPGGHLLAFGGTRMYHRLATGVEDAGFEVRDMMSWLYGSGFPKSLDVSKAIDKKAGAQREALGVGYGANNAQGTRGVTHAGASVGGTKNGHNYRATFDITAPATEEAKRWEGWGTALKPAQEPIVVARKPLIGTVAENVLAHGTGAINIDASRIGLANDDNIFAKNPHTKNFAGPGFAQGGAGSGYQVPSGRWPTNILFDEEAAAELDRQSGVRAAGNHPAKRSGLGTDRTMGSTSKGTAGERRPTDSGGASRFFYVAKPGKKERNAGLDGFREASGGFATRYCSACGKNIPRAGSCGCVAPAKIHPAQPQANIHPTVKPITLMGYLIKLVTPPGGVVLDPFLGSGSTACAAVVNGFDYLGIEQRDEYADIAEARIAHYAKEVDNG